MAHALVGFEQRRESLLGGWARDDFVRERVVSTLGESRFSEMAARHWLEHGVSEIACDAIAAWVTGPAYAWQHVRWCWGRKEGKSVYLDSDYHPPEHARLEVVLRVLEHLGERSEIDELKRVWNKVIGEPDGGDEAVQENGAWARTYPTVLVGELTDEVVRGCGRVGIRAYASDLPSDDPCRRFNDAWRDMRTDPSAFHASEKAR
jgi:hypothetical protein